MKPSKTQQRFAPMMDEPDIGSGEKTQGESDTEEFIRQIPVLPETPHERDLNSNSSQKQADPKKQAAMPR